MNKTEVAIVRVYLTESKGKLKGILALLHDQHKVRGVTVFRGIAGFGKSGVMHSASLLDMSLDLPLVVEFFDSPHKVEAILNHLEASVEPGHIVVWSAELLVDNAEPSNA